MASTFLNICKTSLAPSHHWQTELVKVSNLSRVGTEQTTTKTSKSAAICCGYFANYWSLSVPQMTSRGAQHNEAALAREHFDDGHFIAVAYLESEGVKGRDATTQWHNGLFKEKFLSQSQRLVAQPSTLPQTRHPQQFTHLEHVKTDACWEVVA